MRAPAPRDPAGRQHATECTIQEAELLIAVLMFAEGAAPLLQPEITEALKDLRTWRSALLRKYVLAKLNDAQDAGQP